jgi:hypothetical protein
MRTLIKPLLFAAALVALSCCNPARHMKRYLKRHPELVKTDTIYKVDYDTIPEIHVNTVFRPDTNTPGLDSVFLHFQGQIDSVVASKLRNEVHNYIVNRPLFPDTITKLVDGVTVKVFQSGDHVGVIVFRPEEVKQEIIPVTVNKVEAGGILWYDHLLRYLFLILLGAMAGFIFYEKFRSRKP